MWTSSSPGGTDDRTSSPPGGAVSKTSSPPGGAVGKTSSPQEERIGGLLHLQEERLVGPLHPQLALQALEVNTCSRPPTLHIAPVYTIAIKVREIQSCSDQISNWTEDKSYVSLCRSLPAEKPGHARLTFLHCFSS